MQPTVHLDAPVEYGDIQIAPTTELAGLTELGLIRDFDERVAALLRIAKAITAEDEERERIAMLRAADVPPALPQRR